MHEHVLAGCTPTPLSGYLKALGVLRLMHHKDSAIRGWWNQDEFVVRTKLSRDELLAFLTEEYCPTPVLSGWNGGGGLFLRKGSKDPETGAVVYDKATTMTKATDDVADSAAPRLHAYRTFIKQSRDVVTQMGLVVAPKNDPKRAMLQRLRDTVSDEVLPWLDAVVLIGEEGNKYPPLLGTGGCDGNLDFGNNFQQRLQEVMDFSTGHPTNESLAWAGSSVFGDARPGMVRGAVGQFDPARAGSANAGEGFSGLSVINPWDFILFMEGTLVMAAAATKRLESALPGSLSYPFTVRTSGAGSASLSDVDEDSSRNEMWLPLWDSAASWPEIQRLFGEGRATVGRRPARDAVDFARAIGTLGVDRGISSFVRYAFLRRNGLSFVATPLGRWRAMRRPSVDLLEGNLDRWLGRLRRAAKAKNATASARSAYRRTAQAVLELCEGEAQAPQLVQNVLIELAAVERLAAKSPALREIVPPVPRLDSQWLRSAEVDSATFRLARSLASTGIRRRMLPIDPNNPNLWAKNKDHGVVWSEGVLVDNLIAVLRREEAEWGSSSEVRPRPDHELRPLGAAVEDVQCFIDGAVNDLDLAQLTHGLGLVKGEGSNVGSRWVSQPISPLWAMAALAWDQRLPPAHPGGPQPRRTVGLIEAGANADGCRLSELALRRLRPGALRHRAPNATPSLGKLGLGPQVAGRTHSRRVTAALCFPLEDSILEQLSRLIFRTKSDDTQEQTS